MASLRLHGNEILGYSFSLWAKRSSEISPCPDCLLRETRLDEQNTKVNGRVREGSKNKFGREFKASVGEKEQE